MDTLAQIFNNAFFRVPDYQRGYAWEESHLEDFWKDLNWLRPDQQHYTGMITLFPLTPDSIQLPANIPHKVYHLVDGQQRLTTSYLLLSKLIARAKNGMIGGQPLPVVTYYYLSASFNDKQIPVFGYDSPAKMSFLNTLIERSSATAKKTKKLSTKNVYEKNLLFASDFLDKRLNKISDQGRDDLFNRLTNQLVFDIHTVNNAFDVCAMFESINYRGKRLTKFEVLKNRLIYLSELMGRAGSDEDLQNAQNLRKTIECNWGAAFDWFGKGKDPLDEDDFLLQHTKMYFGAIEHEKDALNTTLFKERFSTDRLSLQHKEPLTFDEIRVYVENIKISSELWAFQNSRIPKLTGDPIWITQEIVDWILRLNRLKMRHFKPLILGALNRMFFASSSETADTFLELLKEIERFNFIVYGLCDYTAALGANDFEDYGNSIYKNESNFSFEEVVTYLKDYLCSYDDVNDEFSGVFDLNKLINKVHARFFGKKGWYKWEEIRYFLSEWETHFKSSNVKIISAEEYDNEHRTVEHIMPQNPNAAGLWQINQSELGKRFEYVVHDLGNLTILGSGANKAVQDFNLKCKADAYRMTCDGQDILIRSGKSYRWGNDEILARGQSMVEFMCERWLLPGQEEDSELLLDFDDVLSTNVNPPRKSKKSA